MYNTIIKSLFWHGLKRDVVSYVTKCLPYQNVKVERALYPRKLQPKEIPQMKCECICMSFVTGMLKSHGYDTIFIKVDLLT